MYKSLSLLLFLGVLYLLLFEAGFTGCCNKCPSKVSQLLYELFSNGKCPFTKLSLDLFDKLGGLTLKFFRTTSGYRCSFVNELLIDARGYPYCEGLFGYFKKLFNHVLGSLYFDYLFPSVKHVNVNALFFLIFTTRLLFLSLYSILILLQFNLYKKLPYHVKPLFSSSVTLVGQFVLATLVKVLLCKVHFPLLLIVGNTVPTLLLLLHHCKK